MSFRQELRWAMLCGITTLAAVTPLSAQQKSGKTDLAITRDIRMAINGDKTLSIYAHNVKILTRNGQVTLKGPVRTDAEKQVVEAKATAVAGEGHVISEVSVAPAKSRAK